MAFRTVGLKIKIFWYFKEYRFPIYKWVQGVSFLSGGTVAASYSEIFENDYKISFGAGLRIVLNKKTELGLDSTMAAPLMKEELFTSL